MTKILSVGEVVYNNDMPMVVIAQKIREDISSMSYDRSYKLCSLTELENKEIISEEDFDKLGMWVDVKGTEFPDIKRVENVAPFNIKPTKVYRIKQKQAKTITIFE